MPTAWEDAITRWLLWLKISGIRPASLKLRRDQVRVVAKRSRTREPAELTFAQLVSLLSEQKWSNEYRKGVRTALNNFYEWAIREGIAEHNPAAELPKVTPELPHPRPATDEVWLELLERAGDRERIMALLACEAGLRRAEVAAVNLDDLIEAVEGPSLIVHGKGGKQRVVPISAALAAEMRKLRPEGGYLFPGNEDGHLSAGYVGTLLSDLMPRGWSMHKLRHRFATKGFAGTGNLRAVQEALGHASVATTQRYTAVAARDLRAVSDAASRDSEAHLKVPERVESVQRMPAQQRRIAAAVAEARRLQEQTEQLCAASRAARALHEAAQSGPIQAAAFWSTATTLVGELASAQHDEQSTEQPVLEVVELCDWSSSSTAIAELARGHRLKGMAAIVAAAVLISLGGAAGAAADGEVPNHGAGPALLFDDDDDGAEGELIGGAA